jgi:hypothetical protein
MAQQMKLPLFFVCCAAGITLVHFAFVAGCGAPQAELQNEETAGTYEGALQACNAEAKLLDGGRPYADACMCQVAARFGRLDSGVLGCVDGGAK